MYTLEQIKQAIISGSVKDGDQFTTPTGAVGTYTARLSQRGKIQAVFTCTWNGCQNTHEREISDWHQCGKCVAHAKIRLRDIGRKRTKKKDITAVREMLLASQDALAKRVVPPPEQEPQQMETSNK